jgi:hypothetical protein
MNVPKRRKGKERKWKRAREEFPMVSPFVFNNN